MFLRKRIIGALEPPRLKKKKFGPKKKRIDGPTSEPKRWELSIEEIEKQCQRPKQCGIAAFKLGNQPVGQTDYGVNLNLYAMPTGCGLYAMAGISNLGKSNISAEKLAELNKLITDKVGKHQCIAALGDSYFLLDKTKPTEYSFEKNLAALGFRKLVSYHNFNHGVDYMQTMFIREVNS